MRLIDANALIEAMKKTESEYENAMTCPSWWSAFNVISEQPTAYDLDKVVEELKTDSSIKLYGSQNSDNYLIPVNKAIEIVKQEAEKYNNGWIPCSERLPEERDWCLAVFEEVDTGFIGLPYIAEYLMGKHTIATTEDGWIIHNCTDREDVSSEYYKKLRCVAWQPLPEPFKERD